MRAAVIRTIGFSLLVGLMTTGAALAQPTAGKDRLWAFPVASAVVDKSPVPVVADPQHLPGSSLSFAQKDIDAIEAAVDWFPDQHPPMPRVASDGQYSGGYACASCHLPNGWGHPESSDLVGLTADYIVKSMAEFKSGLRKGVVPMANAAKHTSDEDTRAAAAWFASLKADPPKWTRVVETTTVPKTYLGAGRMRFVDPAGGQEPLGDRIITVPEDAARARLRDPRLGFVAYVPPGSVARGAALAKGGAKTVECAICHGEGLKGLGNVPRIAGSHPIYIVRQLYGFKTDARNGPDAQLMKRVVNNLSDTDIIDLAAYIGSMQR